jgi:copper chaperone NosL
MNCTHLLSRLSLAALAATVALALPGCGGEEPLSPPHILYGQQECEHCRMIISDGRFAAAMIVDRADGTRATPVFDDINCLFDFEHECEDCSVLMRYLHDVNTRQWLDASGAAFVFSEAIETPMASGVAAAESRDGLTDLQRQHNGEFLDFAALQQRFTKSSLSTAERN